MCAATGLSGGPSKVPRRCRRGRANTMPRSHRDRRPRRVRCLRPARAAAHRPAGCGSDNRVVAGKTKRIYELQFVVREGLNRQRIIKTLQPVVGMGVIEHLRLEGSIGAVAVSKQGLDSLRSYARKKQIPFKNILSRLFYSQ